MNSGSEQEFDWARDHYYPGKANISIRDNGYQ